MEDVKNLEDKFPESSRVPILSSENKDHSNVEVRVNQDANGKLETELNDSSKPVNEQQQFLIDKGLLTSTIKTVERGQDDEHHRESVATDSETRAMHHISDGPELHRELSVPLTENLKESHTQIEESITPVVYESIPSYSSKPIPHDSEAEQDNILPLKDESDSLASTANLIELNSEKEVDSESVPPYRAEEKASDDLLSSHENSSFSSPHESESENESCINLVKGGDENKVHIDTAAPIESVKHAVSKFGGIVDWKAHRVQTVEKRKFIDQELEKAGEDIPMYKKRSEEAEGKKLAVLKELDGTKRLIEELKLNLERAQTEEHQAKQDAELAKLRVEEMEHGIADDSSVAAKAQLEVARARHTSAVAELQAVKDELEELRKVYTVLVADKVAAVQKAAEAVAASKEVEKTVEDLTIELITAKESLESAHAAHLEAEEQRIVAAMSREQDILNWTEELRQAERDLEKLNQQIHSAKDHKSKLDSASALLKDLKCELAAYMQSKQNQEDGDEEAEQNTHADMQKAIASAKNNLEELKMNIMKSTDEVNCLKLAADSLKEELEREKEELETVRQREGMASEAVASIEAEVNRTKADIALAQMRENEAREKMVELPKQLQAAAQEAEEAKLLAQTAREALSKAKEEAEQARAGVTTVESRLLAARKEIDAAKASEKLALNAITALQESNASAANEDSTDGITLSLEEYYELSKRAHEAEEEANARVTIAHAEIETAKESEQKSLNKLDEVTCEMAARKEELEMAKQKAESAMEGKLGVEQELRTWRAEHEQRRKAVESAHGNANGGKPSFDAQKSDKCTPGSAAATSKIPRSDFEEKKGSNKYEVMSSPKSIAESESSHDGKTGKKKKKKSIFPRFFMFLMKKKSSSTKSS